MEPNNKTNNSIVETYADDMAKFIENDSGDGLIKKIIHGEEEHEAEKRNFSPESKKNIFFIFVGTLLIVAALVTLAFFFLKTKNNTVKIVPQFIPLIFNDQSTYFEVFGFKKDEIIQTVNNEVNATKVQVGGVEGIYLMENSQKIGLRRFITLIKSSFAPPDNTLLVNDDFLLGVVNTGSVSDVVPTSTGKDFFILLKVRSNLDIFNSLRSWEGNILNDLSPFLGINIGSDNSYLFTKGFQDGVVENKNARILYDKNGNVVIMYIFADDNSVIITSSQKAAHIIMSSLSGSQTKK